MTIVKLQDCEITDPPSTLFAMVPELPDQASIPPSKRDSDLAFIAELVDLPTANRVKDHPKLDAESQQQAQRLGCTPRVSVISLAAHFGMPNATEKYKYDVLQKLYLLSGIPCNKLLETAFAVRIFHW